MSGRGASTVGRRTPIVDTARSPFCVLQPVDLTAVHLEDEFWSPRRTVVRTATLPVQFRQLEQTGRLDNFRRAAGSLQGEFAGRNFNDSDIYKWLEAASWILATDQVPELTDRVREVIALIAAAQDESGYLDTYFAGKRANARWSDLRWAHELYCAGHLIQAAIAQHRATGDGDLLGVAVRLAGHIVRTFGPGARSGACGHPEIEMALVELTRETGDAQYLRLAEFFIGERGRRPSVIGGEAYAQDHVPFRDQHIAVGHAVRALYLYCGATDVFAETGEPALWGALQSLWLDLTQTKMYITGGVGSRYEGESIGDAYELPNLRAYAETCAAIANVMWNWRMLLVTGAAPYADVMETALYNGVLAGMSLDGVAYFYENPLADRGHRRQPWFDVACCPPNIARLIAAIPGYFYSTSENGVWVHLYASSTAEVNVPGAGDVVIVQRTRYPWEGEIEFHVECSPASFSLMLRIPSWCRDAAMSVNGVPENLPLQPGHYAAVRRSWRTGDVVRLTLPMPVRTMASHPHVLDNHDRLAVTRGPLVYCVEQADQPETDVWSLSLLPRTIWTVTFERGLLGGVAVLHSTGSESSSVERDLYQQYRAPATKPVSVRVNAIPYFAWANREPGPMLVWLPLSH